MITLYIIYYSKMCELFLQDDIIDVLKSKIDIRDYDKLKKVSVKYKKIFDLKSIIDSKKYENMEYSDLPESNRRQFDYFFFKTSTVKRSTN